jgi:RNA-directed DNA polymerase
MKRYGNLYPKIYDMQNIELAHKNARSGKSHYTEVKKVDANPESHFSAIHEMLENKTFANSDYEVFRRVEGGKEREIFKLPYFPDRIIHHAILQIVGPIWTKGLIADTYACIAERGIHKGVRRLKAALREKEETEYCLKCDVRKFYPSVDHVILKQIIRRKIKDKDLLWLLDTIIDSTAGIPIGNYLSQHFGNLYLSDFDHWMKEARRSKYYFRYCDDLVVLDSSKAHLHDLRADMTTYLSENLRVELKQNWQVFPVAVRGIDFLGYRFFHGYTLLRKSIVQRVKQKILRIKKHWRNMQPINIVSSIMSYYGWMKHANCLNLMKAVIDEEIQEIVDKACFALHINNPLADIAGMAK